MNAMNMPGFTAENALYNSGRKYNMPSSATERSSSGVAPQAGPGFGAIGAGAGDVITIDPVQCKTRCRLACNSYFCWWTDCYKICF
jgi:hypothetical protein